MCKPVAILAVDNNPDYLFLLPIVCESWRMQGFDVLVNMKEFKNDAVISAMPLNVQVIESDKQINSNNKAIYSQCIRLYMPLSLKDDRIFVTSDADMFIASDFIQAQFRDGMLNAYGKDLTDYHYPMCYVMSRVDLWKQVIGEDGMMADIENLTGYNLGAQIAWTADQDILTKKIIQAKGISINHVYRGVDKECNNLPIGRWDRYGNFKVPKGKIHDVHLMREPLNNIPKLIDICSYCYPNENWNWIKQYAIEFKKYLQ